MITLTYSGINGSQWTLVGERQGAEGVLASKVSGFVSSPDVTFEAAAARTGHREVGHSVGAMTGTLDVSVSPMWVESHTPALDELVHDFARAWSTLADGELLWIDDAGMLLRTPARLASPFPTPERSPAGLGERVTPLSLAVTCLDGVWHGPERRYTGPSRLHNPGDLDGYPLVEWSGTSAALAGPGIPTFSLPATTQTAVWDTDPATGGLVTIGGVPATVLRQQMRGRVAPVPTAPGAESSWSFANCTAIMRPRFINPWGR